MNIYYRKKEEKDTFSYILQVKLDYQQKLPWPPSFLIHDKNNKKVNLKNLNLPIPMKDKHYIVTHNPVFTFEIQKSTVYPLTVKINNDVALLKNKTKGFTNKHFKVSDISLDYIKESFLGTDKETDFYQQFYSKENFRDYTITTSSSYNSSYDSMWIICSIIITFLTITLLSFIFFKKK